MKHEVLVQLACMHICIHTYIHAYIHTYIHTYTHTCSIHTYIHTRSDGRDGPPASQIPPCTLCGMPQSSCTPGEHCKAKAGSLQPAHRGTVFVPLSLATFAHSFPGIERGSTPFPLCFLAADDSVYQEHASHQEGRRCIYSLQEEWQWTMPSLILCTMYSNDVIPIRSCGVTP